MKLSESVVMITGAGQGIGAQAARQFADEGAKGGLLARTESKVQEICDEIRAAGGDAIAIRCDVANEEDVKNAFPEVAVVKSSDILLEIIAKGISKAEAVKRFCAHLGISPEETIAFGDNFNDVEMLEAVGRS